MPAGAVYLAGGTEVDDAVSWTIPSLAADGGVTQTRFVVTAAQTITNSDYGDCPNGGYSIMGDVAVTTEIDREGPDAGEIFLPIILKE